jgi:hypothetical protein
MAHENRYDVPIEDLESATRVPVEDQVVSVPEPPAEDVLATEELNRARALSPTGDFRLRP